MKSGISFLLKRVSVIALLMILGCASRQPAVLVTIEGDQTVKKALAMSDSLLMSEHKNFVVSREFVEVLKYLHANWIETDAMLEECINLGNEFQEKQFE